MWTWLQDKKRGLLVFVLVAGLVVGGLGWATTAALRLEREQWLSQAQADRAEALRLRQGQREQQLRDLRKQAEDEYLLLQETFAARVRLAMWRLDNRFAPVLAREDSRPYNHYTALFAPPVALDSKFGRCEPATILEPSPLLSAELPPWMLLHFQASVERGWGSPQVLSVAAREQLISNDITLSNADSGREMLLDILAQGIYPGSVLGQLKDEEGRLHNALVHRPRGEAPELFVVQNHIGNAKGKDSAFQKEVAQQIAHQLRRSQDSYTTRVGQRGRDNFETQNPAMVGENPWSAWTNTSNTFFWYSPVLVPPALSEQVMVSVGPMVPLWVAAQEPDERLVVVRQVQLRAPEVDRLALISAWPNPGDPVSMAVACAWEHGRRPVLPREMVQGIVLDWPALRELLADEVRDLFPEARVMPMREGSPPRPERTMATLPVELDPGPGPARPPEPREADLPPGEPLEPLPTQPPDLGWTPLRVGLGLSWVAALVALAGVGLGGWSLIDLSQRRIRFVSAVTHELRTPLTTLRLYLDMLTGGLVQDEQRQAEYLHTLNAEAERLNRLVSNVLDFSRLENQTPRLELAPVPVTVLLGQVRDTWDARCQDAGKNLVVENFAGEELTLTTDPQLVQQVLANLIDNACKYSRCAEDCRVWLRARPGSEGRLWLEVEDRGPGVPTGEQRSIFRAFRRGNEADVKAGGVGLGLALARRWAGLLGGQLTIHRCEGGAGACFRLELPLQARS